MNLPITPTAEALLQQLMTLGYSSPEAAIEAALQFFFDSKIAEHQGDEAVDTTLGFPSFTEAEIIQENERRWQALQQQGGGISQQQVEAWVASLDRSKV